MSFDKHPRTAAEWIARLNASDVSDGDRTALAAWLDETPENRRQFEHVSAVWNLAPALALGSGIRSRLVMEPPASAIRRNMFLQPMGLGIAAVLCLALFGAFALSLNQGVYSTKVGEHSSVALEDGSTVWLNTDSRIRVKLDDKMRVVSLEKGEAFFKVAHNAARPFVVEANGRRVVVTGTQFDVRRDSSALEVAVLEGHVRVDQGSDAAPTAAIGQADEVNLLAGDEARFSSSGTGARVQRNAQVARKAAWRDGKIYLERAVLGAALDEINRYTDIKLVLEDEKARNLSISGVFRTGDIDSVLFSVRELYQLQARRQGDVIVLYRDRKSS